MVLYASLFLSRRRVRTGSVDRWFNIILISAALWSMSSMILHAAPDFVNIHWITQSLTLTNLVIPLAVFGFVTHFLSLKKQQAWIGFGVILFLIATVLTVFGFVVTDITVSEGLIWLDFGPGVYIAAGFWSFFMYSAAFFLLRDRRRSKDREFRRRVFYLLVVLVLLTFGNTLNVTPLAVYPVDQLLAALAAALIALSISRTQLLEVQRFARQLVVLLAFLSVFIVVVSGLIYFLGQLEEGTLQIAGVLAASSVAVLLLSYRPLRRRILALIDRIVAPESYDVRALLYSVSKTSNRLRLPQELGIELLQEMQKVIGYSSASIFLKSPSSDTYRAIAILGLPRRARSVTFQTNSPLLAEQDRYHYAMYVDRLHDLPRMQALWIDEWETLQLLKADVLVPVFADDEIIGLITMGSRANNVAYARLELQQTLPTVANQISIALDNSRLYAREQTRADALARANADLRRLDQMRDELIQNMSHELRTPLAVIHGYADLLAEDLASSVALSPQEIAEIILKQSERLQALVNDILTFSLIDTDKGQMMHVDMAGLVSGLVNTIVAAINPGVAVTISVPSEPTFVLGTRDQLRQVIDNLLGNAMKFSPEGGAVHIEVIQKNGEVITSVSDEGEGIKAEDYERIWKRFYKVDSSLSRMYGGAGLGLAIAKKIVERHGGWVGVESVEGTGSTFRFGLLAIAPPPSPNDNKRLETHSSAKHVAEPTLIRQGEEPLKQTHAS